MPKVIGNIDESVPQPFKSPAHNLIRRPPGMNMNIDQRFYKVLSKHGYLKSTKPSREDAAKYSGGVFYHPKGHMVGVSDTGAHFRLAHEDETYEPTKFKSYEELNDHLTDIHYADVKNKELNKAFMKRYKG